MRFFLSLLLILSNISLVAQQKTDTRLQQQIAQLMKGFKGVAGVYVKHLGTGKIASLNADTIFPTASMVKVPILIGIMDRIQKKELDYHQHFVYKDSLLYEGEDILGSFKTDEKIELSKLLMLMLTTSDNTASLWLQHIAGTGTRINQLLDSLGYVNTKVNSRTPGRESSRSLYGWGQTTPKEMVLIFEQIFKRKMINAAYSEKMLRLLGRNYWDEEAICQVPPEIFVASKNGAVDASRSETLLVMAPHGPYIFSVITKNQEDKSWNPENEGWVLERKLSALLWNYFEPGYKWTPTYTIEGKLK